MKKFLRFAILLLIIPAFVLTSCKDDDDDATPARQTDAEFQLLKDHLVASSLDLNNILDGWITTADVIEPALDDYYVIDIRSEDDYETNHIIGAVNSTLANVLTQAANAETGQTVIVVCYSGQTAGHAVAALRLSGYPTAKVLKWGMSGWHTTKDSWSSSCATISSANWTASPGSVVEHTTEYDDPDLTETGDGAAILAARVTSLLSGSLRGVKGADVLAAPGSYMINNYWAAEDVATYGNISGAYRINPLTLAGEEYKYLDSSKDIVTYCWTGQTSSVITAYLYVLGYNSHSLKNGSNSMIYDDLTSHKWNADVITDLPMKSELP
ncbi:MAG: rhodanese-like domain-containing protein [Bacteroidales bacterium]|nr:rhodanese-like domain-containing protein [Bacteroidales bacterium]